MPLYCGIDLHSTSSYLVILDGKDQVIRERQLPNRLEVFLGELEPLREELSGIAVESTFNWYWLVDGLMEAGYRLHLVHTTAVKQYEGLKYSDDRHDARWLAHLMRLGILPTGFIYPKEERPVRDLLRKRGHLVRQRTENLLSLQNLWVRNTGEMVCGNALKKLTTADLDARIADPELCLAMVQHPGGHRHPERPDSSAREGGAQVRQAQTAVSSVAEHRWRRRDLGADHHVRDRGHRPVSGGRQLRLLLSLRR